MDYKYTCFECGINTDTEICKNCTRVFQNGARYALQYLRDEVYGSSVEDTDIWEDFFESESDN